MQAHSWFSEWFNSPYYHLLYSNRDEGEAKQFINQLIEYLQPKQEARMLDVGCGRGRHSRHLATLGFDVTGIDVAPENIQFANQYASTHLNFQVHDMRKTFCAHCMDYVFNFFTSFGYFENAHEHVRALHTMAVALKKRGTLVLDYVNFDFVIQHLIEKEERIIEQVRFDITRWHDARFLYKKMVVHDENKSTTLTYTEKVAKFTQEELGKMIQQQGLQINQIAGNYQLQAFDKKQSPRLIFIAQRLY